MEKSFRLKEKSNMIPSKKGDGKKRDAHAERALREPWDGRFLGDKDWEQEAGGLID